MTSGIAINTLRFSLLKTQEIEVKMNKKAEGRCVLVSDQIGV